MSEMDEYDDGWCYLCGTTTNGECIHREDGTDITNPVSEILWLRERVAALESVIDGVKTHIESRIAAGESGSYGGLNASAIRALRACLGALHEDMVAYGIEVRDDE